MAERADLAAAGWARRFRIARRPVRTHPAGKAQRRTAASRRSTAGRRSSGIAAGYALAKGRPQLSFMPIFIACTFCDLSYEGTITKQLPVFLIIKRLPKPDKKGKTIWGIFAHLRPQTKKGLKPYQIRAQWSLDNRRKGAEEKARKLLNIIGANYEYNKKGKDGRRKSRTKSRG